MIPVFRPALPQTAAIVPYLKQLDASRRYANRGDLCLMFEERLTRLFGVAEGGVLSAASGTAALTAAILASAGRARGTKPLCLCSGYSFVATALAAELCGYRLRFVDVEPDAWAPDPRRLANHPLLDQAGVVLVAAPYGRPFSQAAWSGFSRATGAPVIIDAAAGIERFADGASDLLGAAPVVLSFHATKAFAVGEGGAVVCADLPLLRAAAASLNFGFVDARETTGPGFNGKMSEYHAAVGLAELDGWTEKRQALRRVADAYRRFAAERGVKVHAAPAVGSNYALFEAASERAAQEARARLEAAGFETRLWYGRGLHREPYFRDADHDPLPNVEALAPRLIGLPVASDLPDAAIARIVAVLAET